MRQLDEVTYELLEHINTTRKSDAGKHYKTLCTEIGTWVFSKVMESQFHRETEINALSCGGRANPQFSDKQKNETVVEPFHFGRRWQI